MESWCQASGESYIETSQLLGHFCVGPSDSRFVLYVWNFLEYSMSSVTSSFGVASTLHFRTFGKKGGK